CAIPARVRLRRVILIIAEPFGRVWASATSYDINWGARSGTEALAGTEFFRQRGMGMIVLWGGRHGSDFGHRRNGLAATGQLGPIAKIPHRAGPRDDEKAWPRGAPVHV